MSETAGWQFWIDRGGTFTDIVARSPDGALTTHKHLSDNPEHYRDAALHGIRMVLGVDEGAPIPLDRIAAIKMGTTIATNALLERRGEPTLLAVTCGLGDVIEIGYQSRPDTFALNIEKPHLLYSAVAEMNERILADGTVEQPLDHDQVRRSLQMHYDRGLRAVAIALMHSFKFPEHEQQVAQIAREIGFTQISASHDVSPLSKIVPRGETTIVDAYLTPILRRYVDRVAGAFGGDQEAGQLLFMQSAGGLVDAAQFRGRDAILSGPAGGIVGCVHTAKLAGFDRVIGFDMGGTSTDVSHYAGEFEKVYETKVAGVQMRVPMLHIHTVAAGGGSVLRCDEGRMRVGPQSAGADPGPASYRRGGPLSVTDINVCLGKLQPDHFPKIFGPHQDQALDYDAALSGFAALADEIGDGRSPEQVAEGFLYIAVEHMAQAIKRISISRGYDVQDYVLNCFGGAGGQHACLVAERLGIRTIMLHPFAGVLSAYGMGLAAIETERQRVIELALGEISQTKLRAITTELEAENLEDMAAQGVAETEVEHEVSALLRYRGTDTVIRVPLGSAQNMCAQFEADHARQFGFLASGKDVLLDTLLVASRVDAGAPEESAIDERANGALEAIDTFQMFSKGQFHNAPTYKIDDVHFDHRITGPAIITEDTGTIIIEPGWSAKLNRFGHLIVTAQSSAKPAITHAGDVVERDPVTLEIFNNLFMSIAEQMGIVLRNTSQSVNVKERLDFSCAIFDAGGNLVANAPHVPVHLGSMDACVKTILDSGEVINSGDAFVHNNPHKGGSHLPDVTVVTPVFDELSGDLMFFTASRAHHEDIGGIAPGSMSPMGRTIHEEGVLLDNVKLVESGEFQGERIEKILGSGRYPARNIPQNVADLMAQVAANAAGANELAKLVRGYGLPVVSAYMGFIQDAAEAAVKRAIAELDDGEFALDLDSAAVIKVAVRADKRAGRATIDFTGTSAQLDSAFNAPRAVTNAAILYVFRCLIDDDIPLNAGCMKPLDVIIPKGSMLNPAFPAAVVAGNVETSQAVTDALFAALGKLGTGQGTMNNLTFGNDRVQYYETICSGAPAGPGFDGASAVHTHMTNTRMTDPEILEQRYPVVLDEFGIDRGSGGKGEWNAGDGVRRVIRFREDMQSSILSDRRRVAAPGLKGGEDGRLGRNTVERSDGALEDLGGCAQTEMKPGDRIVIETPTGGGFGPVNQRRRGKSE